MSVNQVMESCHPLQMYSKYQVLDACGDLWCIGNKLDHGIMLPTNSVQQILGTQFMLRFLIQ